MSDEPAKISTTDEILCPSTDRPAQKRASSSRLSASTSILREKAHRTRNYRALIVRTMKFLLSESDVQNADRFHFAIRIAVNESVVASVSVPTLGHTAKVEARGVNQ